MSTIAAFAATASLLGDPARAGIITALMDGRALTATELAAVAGVTPQTASGHLARLREAGLISMRSQGRHRYHCLASEPVAAMVESIMRVSVAARPARRLATGPREAALRRARTCYDHLAGRIAVAMADRMAQRGQIELSEDGATLNPDGAALLRGLGVDLASRPGRVFCRPCLDWSERRPHLAGAVGAALCRTCLDRAWLRRQAGTRALLVTPEGLRVLRAAFELPADA